MARPPFSIVVPTIGRPTLARTLESIRAQSVPAEILVVADAFEADPDVLDQIKATAREYHAHYAPVDAGYHDWGSPQLQRGYELASGEWIMNLGDDDVYEPLAFETIWRAIESLASPIPMMFRTVLHPAPQRGNTAPVVLWHEPALIDKGITGQCLVLPNDQSRIGRWDILVDFGFITSTVALWDGQVAWRTEVVSQCY